MTEDKSAEVQRISRRGFLKAIKIGLTGASLLAACRRTGIKPGQETCQYDNSPGGLLIKEWLKDAREYEVWKELVGTENPHAEEGFSLVFVGGIYFPPELTDFRINPSFKGHHEESSVITSPASGESANNIVTRNPEAGGVLVINPVVVEGATSAYELSENSFFVTPPYGGKVEDLKDIHHMWVAMATRPLKKGGVIAHEPMSKATEAKGTAVTFANITRKPMVSLIPPAGETGRRPGTYDDIGGFWRYAKLIRHYSSLAEEIDFIDSGEEAVRWEGIALPVPSKDYFVVRVGEIRIVKDEAEARNIMALLENPLKR